MRTKLQGWETERPDLKRRIANVHEVLNQERQLSAQLREQLEAEKRTVADLRRQLRSAEEKLAALRASTTMKAGRILATPYRFSFRVVKRAKNLVKSRISTIDNPVDINVENVATGQTSHSSPAVVTAPAPKKSTPKKSAPKPAAKSKAAPSLERQLNDAWYNRGALTEAREILKSFDDNKNPLSEKGKLLAKQLEGIYQLSIGRVEVPIKSEGCAYTPEADRVMYTVHSTPVFNSNGYSTRTRGVAEGIRKEGGDVVVVGRSGYPWDSSVDVKKPGEKRFVQELNGIKYVHTPGGNLNRDRFDHYVLKAADSYVREARLLRPSVIQSASNHRTALPALIAARRVGIPFVYEVRGLWEITEITKKPGLKDSERFNAQVDLETLVATEADVVLAITNQVADELVSRGVSRDKIHVVPNAVDPHEFLPLPVDVDYAKSKKLALDVPTIGFAGSIVEYEGLATLLDASSLLTAQGVNHQIVIAGSGDFEKSLKEQAQRLKLNNVKFLGRLPQSEIPRLMSTFDMVACPRISNEITELVSPLKPLESFASGKPTILSDVAPNRDLAGRDSSRAQLFQAGNAEDLAQKIISMIQDKQAATEMARRARLWIMKERQWQMIGAQMLQQHQVAASNSVTATPPGTRLVSSLKVGLISDEFTATTLAGTFNVIKLSRANWKDQIAQESFDLVFVESAWEGNDHEWHRGVGYYSDEESADLRGLLAQAKEQNIPTVFWNKEDPVHFSRFAPNAVLFDHVATTDANMIEKYLAFPGSVLKTASALPFYAQPSIHNPLPVGREIRNTVAYAGTYYGERYADRSKSLERLLKASLPIGLEIYDRQADNPDSPYKFPGKYRDSVKGAIPYAEVIESYKTHLAHLNVNSVTNSPTMFSRRVVEIPASGGLVLSSAGRGINETLGSTIATSDNFDDYRAFLHCWTTDAEARLEEIWLQMRTIYRSHTAETALTILCRTIGVGASPKKPATYALYVDSLDDRTARDLRAQSVRADAVITTSTVSEAVAQLMADADIAIVNNLSEISVDYVGHWAPGCSRTYYEDLLITTQFGEWDFIRPLQGDFDPAREFVAKQVSEKPRRKTDLVKTSTSRSAALRGVAVRIPRFIDIDEDGVDQVSGELELAPGTKVLIAGHDLKFAKFLIEDLERRGMNVDIDQWSGHSKHDEEQSKKKLAQADVVFCEWGLGNAVWYSKHVAAHQRLIVRVHLQELVLPYLKKTTHRNVDKYLFVGELIKQAAVISHGVPAEKSVVMPNAVPVEKLHKPKTADARFGIGFVGMVPERKRIDLALDLLERLQQKDDRYHLRVKGKLPSDYPWMKDRKEEHAYYEKQYARIKKMNENKPASVIFDGFGSDMEDWYAQVGVVISVSDFESFHLTIADGAASGALPVSVAWDGADLIYPLEWLVADIEDMASKIEAWNGKDNGYSQYISENFDADLVADRIFQELAR